MDDRLAQAVAVVRASAAQENGNMMRPPDACEGVSEDDEWMCGTCAETFRSRRALRLHRLRGHGFRKNARNVCISSVCPTAGQMIAPYGAANESVPRSVARWPHSASRQCKRERATKSSDLPSCRVRHQSDTAGPCRVVFFGRLLRLSRSLHSLSEQVHLNRVSSQIKCHGRFVSFCPWRQRAHGRFPRACPWLRRPLSCLSFR